MSMLRPIRPIALKGLTPARVGDDLPELVWVAPTELVVDATYQRDMSDRSTRLIRKAIENFSWNRIKPPIAVRAADGALHVIDGQHTGIITASLKIPKIPVIVVKADTLDERARAFAGHNKDRTPVSAIDIYRALLAAGDLDAQDVANVCKRAGVRIRAISPASVIAEGDTAAVGVVRGLVKSRGVRKARRLLECLVKARRAPIAGAEIRALDAILAKRPDADFDALAAVIQADGVEGFEAAGTMARRDRVPLYEALARRWLRRLDSAGAA